MNTFEILGLAVAAICLIVGSIAYRGGYTRGHRAGLAEHRRKDWSRFREHDDDDLGIPRPGRR